MPPLSNLATRDVETLVHPYTNLASFRDTGPLVIERGQGRLCLRQRRQGLYRGHGRPVVHGARLRQRGAGRSRGGADAQALLRASVHRPEPRSGDRARRKAQGDRAGADLKVFFCNSGSEANDTQMKLVWYMNNALGRPKKKKIISRIKGLSRRHHRRRLAHRACRPITAISTCRSPACCTPAARIITASPRTARARRISRRGSPPSSTS